jgi:hypothetical protein
LNPTALSVEQTSRLLSATSQRRIPETHIRQDVEDGAPVNPDGTINLVHYAAWLVWEMGRGD